MMASAIGTFEKQSYEEVNITVDFSNRMATSETISSSTVTVTGKGTSTDYSSTMAGTPSVSGQTVICLIKAGTTGSSYNASYRIVTSASQKFEADVVIKVQDVT